MKQIFLSALVFFCFLQSAQSQIIEPTENSSPQEFHDFYTAKRKANKTAAWIAFGSGIAMTIGGIGINLDGGIIDDDTTNNSKGLWLSYLGGATTIASIPLFIAAGKYKRKAKLSLKGESAGIGTFNSNPHQHLSVALSINF